MHATGLLALAKVCALPRFLLFFVFLFVEFGRRPRPFALFLLLFLSSSATATIRKRGILLVFLPRVFVQQLFPSFLHTFIIGIFSLLPSFLLPVAVPFSPCLFNVFTPCSSFPFPPSINPQTESHHAMPHLASPFTFPPPLSSLHSPLFANQSPQPNS